MSEEPMFQVGFTRVLAFAGAAPVPRRAVRSARASTAPHTRASAGGAEAPVGDFKDVVYRRLFNEYCPRVRHHFDCYIDNRDEVDELTAEVFVIAWRKLNPESPMPLTWFLRTADNKMRDRTRRAKTRERALQTLMRGLENPESSLDALEVLALRKAVATLNARERQVVVLTYWDDLSAGEIADVLRTSEGAVWTTLSRARTKLRDQLEGSRP